MRGSSLVWNAFFALVVLGFISCSADSFRTPVAEFRALPTAVGNDLLGWRDVRNAASASQVIASFGNPSRTEDTENIFTGQRKVYFYEAKDEFGNPVLAALIFANACRSLSDQPDPNDCYRLLQIRVVPDPPK